MKNKSKIKYKIVIGLFLCFLLIPLFIVLIWSFTKNWPWPKILPNSFGIRGWKYLFDPKSKSLNALIFSVFLSTVVAIITLIITIPAAKALAHYKFKFKKQIEILLFLPVIVPTMTIAMGIHLQFIKLGLANTFIGVVLIQLIPCIPYSLRILKSVFIIIGDNMNQQARVLGSNPAQTFIYITFPMILPGVISAGSMAFIISFSQYFLTSLIGGGRVITFPMLMFPYIESGDRMLASVYSIVFIITTLIFLIIVEAITKKYYNHKLKEYTYV